MLQVLSHYRDQPLEDDESGQRIRNFFIEQEMDDRSEVGSAALEMVSGKWDELAETGTQSPRRNNGCFQLLKVFFSVLVNVRHVDC